MNAILTLNAGSSSLKFALYTGEREPDLLIAGQVERLGSEARLIVGRGDRRKVTTLGPADHSAALQAILPILRDTLDGRAVMGVGHRVVHGGPDHAKPAILTESVIAELRSLVPLAPLHQPHNLTCLDAARHIFPDAVQVACFDTAFHRGHPWVSDTFALPRRYYDEGVRRYGFHGLSYDFIAGEVAQRYPDLAAGNLIVAHLGNGASMCAIRNGRSIGSTMGFTALDGLPMGTRCGQVDPGVLLYLMDQKRMSPAEITTLLYHESGLMGLSGISGDMRTLEASDAPQAAEAIDYYICAIRREAGALAAVLGGVDGLIFCGGIGENSALVRAGVAQGLDHLGVSIDPDANARNAVEIGTGPTRVLVIPTDEERVIARATAAHLG